MKTFEEIYCELKKSDGKELENIWKKAKKQEDKIDKIYKILILIFNIALIILFEKNVGIDVIVKSNYLKLSICVILFCVLVLNLIFSIILNILFIGTNKNAYKYIIKFKEIVIPKLINNFYDNAEYFPNKEMPESIYDKAFYDFQDKYTSEDYFEAQINNQYSIQMAEVLTENIETYKDSDGDVEKKEIELFHGLFAKIVMSKSIKGELRIVQSGCVLDKQKLIIDSSEFEKYFDVETTDKILGMRILTADVMEELVQFEKKTNMKYQIYINENELYVRFYCGEMFEAGRISDGALNKDLIKEYYYMLNFTYNLSNKLIKVIEETII